MQTIFNVAIAILLAQTVQKPSGTIARAGEPKLGPPSSPTFTGEERENFFQLSSELQTAQLNAEHTQEYQELLLKQKEIDALSKKYSATSEAKVLQEKLSAWQKLLEEMKKRCTLAGLELGPDTMQKPSCVVNPPGAAEKH